MTKKKQGAIALVAVVATIATMAATTAPSQASQTVQDRGTRIAAPADATVVAFAGGGASTQRSGR